MIKNAALIFVTFLFSKFSLAQSTWQQAGILYADNNVTITLEYKVIADLCNTNSGRVSKYRYNIKGQPAGDDFYINWKMDYYDCNTDIICQTNYLWVHQGMPEGINENLDWTFEGFKIDKPFYEVRKAPTKDLTHNYVVGHQTSLSAERIQADENQVLAGEPIRLRVKGGYLQKGAQWFWYKGQCGGEYAGTGNTLTDSIAHDETYFVRAELKNDPLSNIKGDTTACVNTLVKVITNSIAPDSIGGRKIICRGEKSIKLEVAGGKLLKNSGWVWYENDSTAMPIARGRAITVAPNAKTTYYVRAEGDNDATIFIKFEVIVTEGSVAADEIQGQRTICLGQPVTLNVKGGKLAQGAKWVWYNNDFLYSNKIAEGNAVTLTPAASTTYKVRAEGACNSTDALSVYVSVSNISKEPYNIHVVSPDGGASAYPKGTRLQLTPNGGTLADNALWVWYKQDEGKNTQHTLSTGDTATLTLHKNTTVYVRAEGGNCSTGTNFTSTKFSVLQRRKFVSLNIGIVSSITQNSNLKPFNTPLNMVVTFATNNLDKDYNWYIKGKFCLSPTEAPLSSNNAGITTYPQNMTAGSSAFINGITTETRYGATAGVFLGHGNFKPFVGAGWGKRVLNNGITVSNDNSGKILYQTFAANDEETYEGLEVELGFMLRLRWFNIQVGASTVMPGVITQSSADPYSADKKNKYYDLHAGIGFTF